ncbi:hypothetical protein LCGC14_0860850, partial [marine sediment metagenome]
MIKTHTHIKLIILLFLLIPLRNHSLVSIAYADTNYNVGIEKGTQILEVLKYDEQAWKNTVNITSTPSDWFGGDSDKIGSKSKTTLIDMWSRDSITFPIFHDLIFTNKTLSIFPIIRNYGYGEEYINQNYTNYYFIWGYTFHDWSFITKEFGYNPDTSSESSTILQYPKNFTRLLNDYNDYAIKINNNATFQSLNISFPLLTGDELLWQFALRRFPVAKPINNYLITLKDALNCTNASIEG